MEPVSSGPEPTSGAHPPTESTTPSAGAAPIEVRAGRQRALRQTLVIGLSVLALLCLGGGAAAFLFYNKVTTPDLSSPALTTRKYLAAYLIDRDDVKAAQFECAGASGLADVAALRSDIDAREKKFAVSIAVSVDSVNEVSRSGSDASVNADLVLSTVIQGASQHAVEHWTFIVRNDGGWRVCSGHEVT